ncbi:hypothetical protein AOY87_16555 [Escherichia coli]|nr:hypothetical protein [Escherichia coli]OTB42961.1 hypothetical protein AW060_20830 [Escherichia coli]TJP73155.1 hypothetical protein C9Z72_18315 [Escherichia coli]UMR99711.1 hypothetical protein AOY87_16555 [Escherichia coli]
MKQRRPGSEVANGKTLNISPNIIAICWLVGNVLSVLACWWTISLLVLCLLCVACHDRHF